MDVKGTLKAITLELRRQLEGKYDAQGTWQPGDLERRLAAIGVRRDRAPVPMDELPHLAPEDREARRVVDAFLQSRAEAGQTREAAIAEFVRDAAYSWANRLLALRCMEARSLIDDVILQKDAYGGRSLQHNRLAKKQPERCAGEDEGLFGALFDEFERRGGKGKELPLLFNPHAPEVALRPSVAALKRCIALLSGTVAVKGQAATDEVFTAPDALGWTYQYWDTEEKDRVFEKVRTKKGFKIEGADIIPATCIYTEPYMVKFLVQNSLGAIWMGMHPNSHLVDKWEYYVRGADRAGVSKKPVADITFLDPACGSGHFLIEAFELFYAMYVEEGALTDPAQICASILERNLFGIDIDARAAQIAALALVMKAKEKAPDFVPRWVNLVATNIRLPAGKQHLEAFLRKHPEDSPLKPALLAILEGLAHADELGSLLQIEEPVDKELRALKVKYEAAGSPMEQQALWSRFNKPVQGKLPIGVASHEAWKERALERIREHFDADARDTDLGTAFFGEAASKGLTLVDLLARRYDVVAANPPYMGSKNMGAILKKFVERHFAPGKRDLYAAFILRCLQLAAKSGRVAMVTQQSWMFLRSFTDLRALNDEKRKKAPRAFGGMLREASIEEVAHLGEHAFQDSAAAGAFVVLFVTAKAAPLPEHRLTAFRLVGPKSPEEKGALLRDATRALKEGRSHGIAYQPPQTRFLKIPQAPLSYWLPESILDALSSSNQSAKIMTSEGLGTRKDERFIRFVWETGVSTRWRAYSKGGGYARWFGHDHWNVEWEQDGVRVKQYIREHYPPEKFTLLIRHERLFGSAQLVYSTAGRGSLGVRLAAGPVPGDAGPAIFVDGVRAQAAASLLNVRPSSYCIRGLAAGGINLKGFYVSLLPLHLAVSHQQHFAFHAETCIGLKRVLVEQDATERSFRAPPLTGGSLVAAWRQRCDEVESIPAVLHAVEGISEREGFQAYGITGSDSQAVLDETGTPAGWFPLLVGYDAVPDLPRGLATAAEDLSSITREERRTLPTDVLADLKRRLRGLYEAGPGSKLGEEENAPRGEEEDEDENGEAEVGASGARIPIPTETLIEEISQKLEVHPISVFWLLRELREKEGVVSKPELARFVEDYFSVLVLRLLGHRWPREIEAGEPARTWADADGIIPMIDGASEPGLLARVRKRIVADFGSDSAGSVEREFDDIIGRPLGAWLGSDLFKRHIAQFRKRPIAFHIVSSMGNNGNRRGRAANRSTPVFSCLVYYHRLDGDLLPKLRTQYVGPLRTSLQTELGSLEKVAKRSADQDARRLELEEKVEELKAFDARLEHVIVEGFASPAIERVIAKEPLDKWTSRDGSARASATRDAFMAQERRYEPDLNDGVRVNIAPLQRAGLLAADVLAAKDVEKAIADRAEWRADERRWCREGKLPQPGWWPTGKET